jgi:hypothetical protein
VLANFGSGTLVAAINHMGRQRHSPNGRAGELSAIKGADMVARTLP